MTIQIVPLIVVSLFNTVTLIGQFIPYKDSPKVNTFNLFEWNDVWPTISSHFMWHTYYIDNFVGRPIHNKVWKEYTDPK
jgi:hypothetical protein